MNDAELDDLNELVEYLARTSRLEPQEARRVVDEVLSFLVEEPEPFVRRRHLALQRQGLANTAIFVRLQAELAAAPLPGAGLHHAAAAPHHLRLGDPPCAASSATSASVRLRPS